MAVPDIPPGFDFTDPEIYTTRVPAAGTGRAAPRGPGLVGRAAPGLRRVRRRGVLGRHPARRHHAISKTPEVYSSWENTALIRFQEGMPRESIEMQRFILLNIDPPEHTQLRGIVSRGFTPRAIGNLRQALTERAERIVATALESGTGDFVADVASELPLQAISELLGVPQEDRGKIFSWSNRMIGYDERTPGEDDDDGMIAATEILGYSLAMAEERRGCPRDDIVTKLISAEIDGNHLSDDEFGFFVLMLAVAGNETTRNAIAHGMLAFLDHPDQWELFKASRPETAADEIVRWATPITVFQRTAIQRHGPRRPGDQGGPARRAVLPFGQLRRGGLRPPRACSTSCRNPNPHLGYGGLGTHYCLGASLAKLEIELIFNAIADAMPDIAKAGDPGPPALRLDQRHQVACRSATPAEAPAAHGAPRRLGPDQADPTGGRSACPRPGRPVGRPADPASARGRARRAYVAAVTWSTYVSLFEYRFLPCLFGV